MLDPRQYQKEIVKTAIEKNTLVVLPTGLGKTMIALMLAMHKIKQHPMSKVLFLAPTKPLVEQHFESFKKQLPDLFAELSLFTGDVPAKERKKAWQTTEIIFSTPQCIANDLGKALYDAKDVSLLIIDEAHRCLKNYDYTNVARMYKQQSRFPHILGLTASPGTDADVIKQICNHLNIEEIELRTRDSPDVKPYLQELEFTKVEVPFPKEFVELRVLLQRLYDARVEALKNRNLLFGPANKITLLKLQASLAARASPQNFNALQGMSLCAQAIKISHALELLETQTLSGLDVYLQGLVKQAQEKKSKGVQTLVNSQDFQALLVSLKQLRDEKIEHPKIEELAVLVETEFQQKEKSKVIIFTQFRETASTIVKRLSLVDKVKAEMFVGQAKKGDTGLSQKKQREIVDKFRSGEVNVLVATSIGEEGLDIPEVGAVVFYEPIPSAIRTIQRTGRTARLAPGKLFILIAKDTRDVTHHYAAAAREKKMHKVIHTIKEELRSKPKRVEGKLSDFL